MRIQFLKLLVLCLALGLGTSSPAFGQEATEVDPSAAQSEDAAPAGEDAAPAEEPAAPAEEPAAPASADEGEVAGPTCADGLDNDEDGWIDLKDPGCKNDPEAQEDDGFGKSQCNDGRDNDDDGTVDADDERCTAAGIDNEENPLVTSAKKFLPILILLIVIILAIARLPRVEGLGHTDSYRKRRVMNWAPLGLTYAFLYMGRYNLTVSKNEFATMNLMDNADFGIIFGIGTLVYGCAFLINGPITDRWGGRRAILIGAGGAMVMNLLMGLVSYEVVHSAANQPGPITDTVTMIAKPFFAAFAWFRGLFGIDSAGSETSVLLPALSLLYAGNMYFQSFGAVAIVKANAPWFHVRERGVFGAIFGILISLGVYFAYDWNALLLDFFPGKAYLVFFVPAALLAIFWVVDFFVVRNRPSLAGFEDFHTGDASAGDDSPPDPALVVFKRMLTNPIILTIAGVEFCSGFLRQAIMQWGYVFSKQVLVPITESGVTEWIPVAKNSFVSQNWGMLLCCAGILGGVFAGTISDHVFQSRRGPVAAVLYGGMVIGGLAMYFLLDRENFMLMWLLIFMSLCVIGVHGMLSGTASMDFGGAKNAGIAVGIIDGFVYLGTAIMSFWYGWRLPKNTCDDSLKVDGVYANGEGPLSCNPAGDASNWVEWPIWMLPIAVVGFLLATRVWNAKPKSKVAAK
ncbi:MAG: MFS transporter [Myxococcota bacterium]|nr:MFS transporter [Myxococcota bacterium]